MPAVGMRVRAELRARWRPLLTLAVLAGLAGGVAIAAVAGARRTDSAVARQQVAYRLPHVIVGVRDPSLYDDAERILALPEVEAATVFGSIPDFDARDANGRPVETDGPQGVILVVRVDDRRASEIYRWKLLSGRRPEPRSPREVLLDSKAADRLGVEVGDTIPFRGPGPSVALQVVGIRAPTDPVNFRGGIVETTPAFHRTHEFETDGFVIEARLRGGAADVPSFRSGVDRIQGGTSYFWIDQRDHAAKTQRPIHLQAQALSLAAGLGALLTLALLYQALSRIAAFARLADPTLRALGMTSRQLVAVGVARAGAVASVAAVLAVGVAAALSPLAPIGLARELEPDPGFRFDLLAVGAGGAVLLVALLLSGALAAARSARAADGVLQRRTQRAGVAVAEALGRCGLPATVATGVRLALARGRGSAAVPVGAALVGGILAVAVVGTALTFSASLHHLFSTPRLFGENWDYTGGLGDQTVHSGPVGALRDDPSISAAAVGVEGFRIRVNGRGIAVRAMDDLKGKLPPTVIEGRAPERRGEIMLATKTLDALGLRIGDAVYVAGTSTARMRIVGRGVVAEGSHNELGTGAAMTFDALRQIVDGLPPYSIQARIAPGADRERTLARLHREFAGRRPSPPPGVSDIRAVDGMTVVVSALLTAVAAGALAHTLSMAIRRRRRDLAILKTLGFDRRQVVATVAWQATTFAAVGLLVGLPLGVAAGRWAWHVFAVDLGVVPEPVTPIRFLLLVLPGAVLLANLVAAVPARMAASTRPALVLRAE